MAIADEPVDLAAGTGRPVGDLLRDMELHADPATPGRYTLDISPAWNVFYTFGGFTMAVALRAAQAAVGRDDLHPLSAHAMYCSPIGAGPVEIDTVVVRDGRTAANVSVDMRQAGNEGTALRMSATFGRHHETDMAYTGVPFPTDVRPPDECPMQPDPAEMSSARSPFPPINFHFQTDWRPALAGFSWEGDWGTPVEEAERDARFASWFRLLREARLPDGTIDPISYCVPADMIGAAVGRRLSGPDGPRPFLVLSLSIDLQILAPTRSPWTLQNAVSQHAGGGYAYGTTELWDGDRCLIGFATQRARLRPFTAGEQLGPDAR